jgi:hypothetical protein
MRQIPCFDFVNDLIQIVSVMVHTVLALCDRDVCSLLLACLLVCLYTFLALISKHDQSMQASLLLSLRIDLSSS